MNKWDPLELSGLTISTFSVQHLNWKHVFKGRSLKLVLVIIVQSLSPTLHDPMNCSMPGFPVLHYFLECSDSCPLSHWCHSTISFSVAPSPPVFNLSQLQGLFQWVCSLYQVAKVLGLQLQRQSFQQIFRADFF